MLVELHMLQNFAPSNLNRDDTGSPKDCDFGGYRRARISSQCLKRAIRNDTNFVGLIPEESRAVRTKRAIDHIADLLEAAGRSRPEARSVAEAALKSIRISRAGAGAGDATNGEEAIKTQYLLYLGRTELRRFADLCNENWEMLVTAHAAESTGSETKSAREKKQAGAKALPKNIQKAFEAVLDGGKAADLALFGRMLADLPEKNTDAASQVAHALSTNQVSVEFDFYTAVDDLKPDDTSGADMLGTIEFNSACFYRYANVDFNQLVSNLDDDVQLANTTMEAFLRAAISAVPSGKQNSFAAHNPPSLILAVARDHGAWSLANAFLRPIRPDAEGDLMEKSISALDRYWANLSAMYGAGSISGTWVATLSPDRLETLASSDVGSVDELVAGVLGALA